ncbi:TetR/AcrR family transcriptional regulator [Streptomyces sp. NBC_00059]|uniref:TetR/AcrR family transcriptional regulator n=1 Tax=Streptomyces sp. NBC_00059 TaxID=2975635 RepID=UPI002250A8AD|nr:TetR/AcrR family transcriptional regulator [Streptomyces sp. NBC_00059]MCX5417606.1 TetR/AcrR family transcriptional regulator [Streptomyces sp. NBC_00059]
MPKLWNETIEAHRHAVREATLDATATLVAEHGLLSVTMSRIAQETGIGRATLYKYFPDVESILAAWHERQVSEHLARLLAVRDQAGGPWQRLQGVLETYALISYERRGGHHGADVAALLHQGEHMAQAHQQLFGLVRDLLAECAESGALRTDVSPDELAGYTLHALGAAGGLPSKAAVRRLVGVTMAGLRPASGPVEEVPVDETVVDQTGHPHHHGHQGRH